MRLGLAVLGCLAVVVLTTILGPPDLTGEGPLDRWRLVEGGGVGEAEPAPAEEVPVEVEEVPEPLLGIPAEVVLSMAVAIVAGALLVRSLMAARPGGVDEPDEAEEDPAGAADVDLAGVAAAAHRGLARLDELAGGEPGEVVVACWVELEQAGSGAGSARLVTDTPSDFARRLVAAVPDLDPVVLGELRRTYSTVRYGRRGADAADVARARSALQHLLLALPAARPGTSTTGTTGTTGATGTTTGVRR